MDSQGFFTRFTGFLKANRLFFLVAGLIILSTFGYLWWRAGFTLDVNRFFACTVGDPGCTSCPLPPEQWTCLPDHDCDDDGFLNPDVGGEDCNDGDPCVGGGCAPSPTPTTTVLEQHSECNNNNACVIIQGPGDDQCASNDDCLPTTVGCPAGYNDWGGGICWKVVGGNLTTEACQGPANGDMSQTWDVYNRSTDTYTVVANGFHNNTKGCSGTTGTAVNIGKTNASFAPGSHHQVTVTYNANRYSCGRVQVDGCFKNEATGECRDSGGGLALGAVIDYGTNCVAPTASPAPTRSTPPSPTPTPTPTITTTPTTSATPTPTPTGSTLPPVVCSPTTQPVTAGHAINLTASGGTGTYAWYTIGGLSTSASGATYAVTFATIGTKVVVVASGGNMASCTVFVYPPPTPTPSLTPTPTASITPTPTSSATPTSTPVAPALTLQKLVRNVTQGSGEADSVNANPSDTVEFSLRVSSVGIGSVLSAVVRDSLPAGLTYIPGSTTVDGAPAADGIVASGLNLGDLASGRTVTVRFRASVAAAGFFSQGSTVMTNTGYARGSNAAEVNDVAFVNVVNAPQNLSMSLTKMGRNTSRGQTGEASPVYAAPAETVEFILRVRNTSNAVLTNVLLRDIVPQGMTALAGSVRVNGSPAPDSLTSGGLSLGTLAVGQEITVLLSARVAVASQLPAGTTTVLNTAQASADSIGTLTAQLPVIITTPTTPVTQVPTGPGESTLLALIVSAIITLLYVGYTSTDAYRRHEAGALAKGAHDDKDLFDFRR